MKFKFELELGLSNKKFYKRIAWLFLKMYSFWNTRKQKLFPYAESYFFHIRATFSDLNKTAQEDIENVHFTPKDLNSWCDSNLLDSVDLMLGHTMLDSC